MTYESSAVGQDRAGFLVQSVPRIVVALLLVASLVGPKTCAQQPSGDAILPPTLSDGRPLRPIGFFQSQAPELVPEDYFPVEVDELNAAIRERLESTVDDRSSRLRSAEYWIRVVDGTLVSDPSIIDLESNREGIVRRNLGKVNFAIDGPQRSENSNALSTLPRLESSPNGDLHVVFQSDASTKSDVEFKWRLFGKNVGSGHDFLLRLPRCPQTRIVLAAPSELVVDSLDGVLRKRPAPPPDAGQFLTDANTRWYELDAGGLTSVRLRTRRSNQSQQSETIVVRRTSFQYSVNAGLLDWESRMIVQVPANRKLPPVIVSPTTITSVRVNGVETTFSTDTRDRNRHLVNIDLPGDMYGTTSPATTITLSGKGTWEETSGWCNLPMPVLVDQQVVHASTADEMQMSVPQNLDVMQWQIPAGWKRKHSVDAGRIVYQATGPPQITPPIVGASATNRSRVRLRDAGPMQLADSQLLVEVTSAGLRAKAQMNVTLRDNQLEPIDFELQRGWTLDSVSIPSSKRDIDISRQLSARRLTIWPEAADVADGQLAIEFNGTSRVGLVQRRVMPTWFCRPTHLRGTSTIAVVAPTDLNWSGDAAAKIKRMDADELSDAQREFFGNVKETTLLFEPASGMTPALTLQAPGVSFNVSTTLLLQRDGNEIVESLIIETDSESQVLPELTVQTGSSQGRPPYRWLLQAVAGDSPPISLPSTDARSGSVEGEVTIDVSDRTLRDRRLVGRRRYALDGDLSIQLPSVPSAASQSSSVHVGSGLVLKEKDSSVLSIPATQAGDEIAASVPLTQSTSEGSNSQNLVTRLRYDAVKEPTIVVSRRELDPNVTIVWNEDVRIKASSRGTDYIEATYQVSTTRPFVIEHEPELKVVSVLRNGEPVDLADVPQRPISLLPGPPNETIRIVWNRDQISRQWFRQCRVPKLEASGIKVKSQYRLQASSDTFAPIALLQPPTLLSEQAIAMTPGQYVVLLRRNIALALGWFCAAIVFAASWYVARRSPFAIAIWVVLMIATACLWWPWHLAIVGWFTVPAVAAVLLVVSLAWTIDGSRFQRNREDIRVADSSEQSAIPTEDSHAFSVASISKTLGIFLFIVSCAVAVARAQTPSSPQTRAVNVLIPVLEDGELSGTTVYIPKSLHDELFLRPSSSLPQEAWFQSASYRVQTNNSRDSSKQQPPLVEADLLLHIESGDRQTNLTKLPYAFSSVRRIETIGELSRIIQFNKADDGTVVARLPRGNAFRLRVTLIPAMSESDQWEKLFLSIPPIASSRLTVEGDQNFAAVRVGGTSGRLMKEADLLRWIDEIGPVNSLEVEFQKPTRGAGSQPPLQRRYWLNISNRHVAIDCEVDPPVIPTVGQTVQLVIRDQELPTLTSSAWGLVKTELVSSSRQLLTLECLSSNPGPVRFFWSRPLFDAADGEDTASIEIPEVIAPALGANSEGWIAFDLADDVKLTDISEQVEALSIDHFLAGWQGYRGTKPDRARIAVNRIPAITIARVVPRPPSAKSSHHLHISRSQSQLRYRATLEPGDSTSLPRTLKLPLGMRLLDVRVDGKRIEASINTRKRPNEVALGVVSSEEPVEIEATAVLDFFGKSRMALPRFRLDPMVDTDESYSISRTRDVKITFPTAIAKISNESIGINDQFLERGWVPEASWVRKSTDQGPIAGGRISVTPLTATFACSQLIALDREDGRWSMNVDVRFHSNKIPDFVDVELPKAWTSSLDASPTQNWILLPSVNPANQLVRIHCDPKRLRDGDGSNGAGPTFDRTLSIRAYLDDAENGRVAAPNVRVLGDGARNVQIAVPTRLGQDAVSWRTSAVEASQLDQAWRKQRPELARRSVFTAAKREWSVELAPRPQIEADAMATTMDARVFPRADGALVIARWDIIPGGLDSIDVVVPNGASCLGAWTAGRAVTAVPVSESDWAKAGQVYRLPLALSQLAQPVELMLHVPTTKTRQGQYLPELVKIPVTQRWLASYRDKNRTADQSELIPNEQRRAYAMARSVIDSISHSLDSVADRPREEVAVWLHPWINRYQEINRSINRDANINVADADPLPSQTDIAALRSDPIPKEQLQWESLDQQLAMLIEPYRGQKVQQVHALDTWHLKGFVLHEVTRLSATNRPASLSDSSSQDLGLRTILVNLLTLVLVAGLLACLWPARQYVQPVIVHPAFWLGIIGLFGMVVAPLPVAAGIVLAAIALPAIPYPRLINRRA